MATTSVFLTGKSHGQRSLEGYCLWARLLTSFQQRKCDKRNAERLLGLSKRRGTAAASHLSPGSLTLTMELP